MYISRLKLYGFKSFLKKSEINFGRGVTCVVGPNGCGKTNIVDAIRWVVGEQKARILRADKSTDVIFNGTSKRKPLNIAEVSLTIHNVSGRIPIDYTDIEITRRLYRNGDSEYLLNKNICRLKDIRDLFMDSGMSSDAYSIIELKMIENILSENPQERKNLFEEAAGVNKYRIQRKAALRKLVATEEDLVRVSDIIGEVDSKVKNLKRQLRQYERYQELSQKLIESEVILAAAKVVNLKKDKDPLEKQIRDQRTKLIQVSELLEQLEQIHGNKQAEHDNVEIKLNKKNEIYSQVHDDRNRIQTEELVLKEQYQNKLSEFTRLNEEITNIKSTIEKTKQRITQLDTEEKTYEKQLQNQQTDQDNYQEKQKRLEVDYQDSLNKLEKLQDEKFILVKKQTEQIAKQSSLKENIDFVRRNLEEITKEQKEKSERHSLLESQIEEFEEQLAEFRDELESLESDQENNSEKLDELEEKQESLVQQKRSLDAHLDKLNNKIDFYADLLESKDGFSPVLQKVLKNRDQFEGIVGSFAELISVDEKYQTIASSILGNLSNLVIVGNMENAFTTLNKMVEDETGNIILTPLENIKEVSISENVKSENLVSFSSVVSCPTSIKKLKDNIFANIYICKDEIFEDLVKNIDTKEITVISESGKIYNQAGILYTISQESNNSQIFGREEKLFKFEQEYDKVNLEKTGVKEELSQVLKNISYYRNDVRQSAVQIKTIDKKIRDFELKIRNNQLEIEQLNSRNSILKNKELEEKTALTSFQGKLEKLQLENNEEQGLVVVEQNISLLKNEVDDRKKQLDDFIREVQNFRVELVKIKNKFDNIRNEKVALSKSLINLEKRLQSRVAQKNDAKTKRNELEALIEGKKLDVEKIFREEKMIKDDLEKIKIRYNDLKEQLQETNKDIYKTRHQKEVLTETINKLEMEFSGLTAKQREIESVLFEKYNQNIDYDNLSELPSIEMAKINRDKLKSRLENIGTVNMAVKDEYEEEAERLKFLTDQKNDLEEAAATVRKVIQEIDTVARKQFVETFHHIRENFKNIFQIFFPGGSTDIKLIGDDDPLDSKVEIFACPGGKKMLSLRMLSAGEKTLTAIALLFGIYQVKPSPFCILDEVDAPLDDANTKRFTNLLKTFSDNTQFIIVTHNKVTMSVADVLFGVTMGEMGVSQIVSVNLD